MNFSSKLLNIHRHTSPSYHLYCTCVMNAPISNYNKVVQEPSWYTNFNICCVYWCHCQDAWVHKWHGGKYTLYKQDAKNSSVETVYFLKITTFLWIILILHPGRSSLLLETVTIKFGRPRTDIWSGGLRAEKKQIPLAW